MKKAHLDGEPLPSCLHLSLKVKHRAAEEFPQLASRMLEA